MLWRKSGGMADAINTMQITELRVDPKNSRMHPSKNIQAIKASLSRFGQQKPIVVDKHHTVIAGNGVLAAATELGWKELSVVVSKLSAKEIRAFGLADNRTAELAEWDIPNLLNDITLLEDDQELLDATGFSAADINKLKVSNCDEATQDDVPEVPKKPVSKTGDIWEMGEHRLICGDATSSDVVKRLLGSSVPFLMVTDPPYGVSYNPKWRGEKLGMKNYRSGQVTNDDRAGWSEAYSLFCGAVAYVWNGDKTAVEFAIDLMSCNFDVRNQIIWKKPAIVISRGSYHWQHEACWYAVRKGCAAKWCGDRSQSTVWDIGNHVNAEGKNNHGTQKPVECMARPIRNHGTKSDAVYDPFVGSGTTIIAAEQLERRSFSVELEPGYVDVCLERWENFTGKKAKKVK